MASMKPKRKQWLPESMEEARKAVNSETMSLREASRTYNVPVETLRRRVAGIVSLDCKPGPPTVLTKEEEAHLAEYCVAVADMGYGLTREGVMAMAYAIVERTGRNHPFKSGHAGRGWYEGFMSRQALLTLRKPQALSYSRAVCGNKETIDDFFAKLGAIYGRLNLIVKPSQIYNADETGVTIVHKPSKVVAQLGRRNVPSLTSAEKGKTHTVLACVSANGQVLPPFMIYPRKRPVPEKMREGAYPNTIFQVSENGWITKDLFFEWLKQFVQMIPPLRPVLLILDGHGSHITIDVIEYARSNEIHLLCLPSHTSHILQPLDLGVFKSFKTFFSKVCRQYMAKNPGRVITEDILSCLVGDAFVQSHTPLNILGGFKKAGIYPFNPGAVSDRQLAPSKALSTKPTTQLPTFSPEQNKLFEVRYEEGYNLEDDATYLAWKNIYHPSPESVSGTATCTTISAANSTSTTCSIASSVSSSRSASVITSPSVRSLPSSEEVLDELLVLPQPLPPKTGRRRKAINDKAREITDDAVLQELKDKEQADADARKMKEEKKKVEQERKARERQEKKEKKKLEQERKAREKEKKAKEKEKSKKSKRAAKRRPTPSPVDTVGLESLFAQLQVDVEDNGQCVSCGMIFSEEYDEERFWVGCDGCDEWYCFDCHKFTIKATLPDNFYCTKCTSHRN